MQTVIISGSARRDGNTGALINNLVELTSWDVVDLNDYDIGYYDYLNKNKADDYLPLMKSIVDRYELLVFATPVYWYAMSGIMKVFFDRFTDLLTVDKALGRRLRKKKMAVVTCSNGGNLGDLFWLPFRETANYLGMEYLADLHTLNNRDNSGLLKDFVDEIRLKGHEKSKTTK
jgi:multimeric flavodoxin WrbA